jgi:hypothetical protein
MKKLSVICFALIFLLSGCSRAFEGDYEVVTDHAEDGGEYVEDSSVREVSSFSGLTNALKDFIDSAAEYGVIKAVDYSGSLEDDFSRAYRDVTHDYPMGVYAVDYISHRIDPILSYYEIEVYITYKLTREEISGVVKVNSTNALYDHIDSALNDLTGRLTVLIANLSVNAAGIKNHVRQYYRENPDLVMVKPDVSAVFYPSPPEDYVEKIIDIDFEYNNTAEILRDRKKKLTEAANGLYKQLGELDNDAKAALECLNLLSQKVTFARLGGTAYDALVKGSANSEGYAMAYKLLCKHYGLECAVVEGKKNSEPYYWNIIRLGDDYYHVDPTVCDRYGLAYGFLKKDSEMWGTYWWDIEQYEECSGGLTYDQVAIMLQIGESIE